MRVVDRETFMQMPAGIFFSKGKRWAFKDISVKGETVTDRVGKPIDWYYRNFAWVDAHDSTEAINRLDEMLKTGCSYPIDSDEQRDGYYEKNDVFIVFERSDLEVFRRFLDIALGVAEPTA